MTAYLNDEGHINTTINSFQAEKIGHQVFKLTVVYAGYDSVRQLYTTDMPEWDAMWGRLMEISFAYPSIIIATETQIAQLPAEFTSDYPTDTNHYVTGAPNLEKILKEPKVFGWYNPPLFSEAQVAAVQGLADIGAAVYLILKDSWGSMWYLDTLIVMEISVGAIMTGFSVLTILDEGFIDFFRRAKLAAIVLELGMGGLAWYAYAENTSYIETYIVSMIVHPLNSLVYFAYWLFTK